MGSKLELITNSPEDTEKFAIKFSKSLKKGDCIALIGELGSGKTTFTRGIAKGIGIDGVAVSSPTFKIISEYNTGFAAKFYHVDFYRLEKAEDLIEIGLEELFSEHAIVIIEWADKFLDCLPDNFIEIRFLIIDETSRKIEIKK